MSLHNTGVILNISSDLSVISPDQRLYEIANKKKNQQPVKPVTYSVVKSGLIGLTKTIAREVASRNITANAIAPGYIETDMVKELPDELRSRIQSMVPLGRLGTGDDVAGMVAFLCSEDANYITGQVIGVDGGLGA